MTVSCSVNEIVNPEQDSFDSSNNVVYAVIADTPGNTDTKVYADSKLRVLWNEDDCISYFAKTTYNGQFIFLGEDGDNAGSFAEVPNSNPHTGNDVSNHYAVYPYQLKTSLTNDEIIRLTLPAEQTYKKDSFGIGANTMASKTPTNELKFKNVGGYLSFKFYGEGISVSSITLKGNNGEKLAGKCTIDMSSGEPAVTMDQEKATEEITLTCDPPVSLGSSSSDYVEFWMVVPPTTFSKGITFTVMTSDGGVWEKTTTASFDLPRNVKRSLPVLEVVPTTNPTLFGEFQANVKVPFICQPFYFTYTKEDFSSILLESMGIEYNQFINDYTFTGIYCYEKTITEGQLTDELRLICPSSVGNETKLSYYDPINGRTFDYGTVCYEQGPSVVYSFIWIIDPQKIGQGTSKTFYFRFEEGSSIVYFAMNVNVAVPAIFDYGSNKISNEWFDDIDGEYKNTARVYVRVPNSNNDDVTEFWRKWDHYFIGYSPSVTLSADSYDDYYYFYNSPDYSQYLSTTTQVFFAPEQPSINGIQLYSNYWEDGSVLYAGSYQDVMTVVYNGKNILVPRYNSSNIIAEIDSDGIISYNNTPGDTIAKELLNLWSYTATDQAKMLYANIVANVSYGDCCIPAGESRFHIRFMRPVDIVTRVQSVVYGETIHLAHFISGITDWNRISIITPAENHYFKSTYISGIYMYNYYRFSSLVVDLGQAEYSPTEVELQMGTESNGIFTPIPSSDNKYTIDITNIENLDSYVIRCVDSMGAEAPSGCRIRIPAYFNYGWGAVRCEFTLTVFRQ